MIDTTTRLRLLGLLPIVHKLGRKTQSGAFSIPPLIPIKVFL
jgi:hypothetical protein